MSRTLPTTRVEYTVVVEYPTAMPNAVLEGTLDRLCRLAAQVTAPEGRLVHADRRRLTERSS